MPLVSRLLIRAALGYLVAGMALAVGAAYPGWAYLRPTWIHFLVVGWLTQLIFGVAVWLFPRVSSAAPWGNVRLVWFGFVGLNLGLGLRLVAEPWSGAPGRPWLLAASAGLQLVAIGALAGSIWPRVRGK